MERTVPSTASEEVELYLRTYYSLLRSTAEVQIRSLEEVHAGMRSLLHPAAREPHPDMAAFIYCLLRLPPQMLTVRRVILAQNTDVFSAWGYADLETWEPVTALARRRKCFYDGRETLACFIASRSDIDDIVPMLTAYQIEWNKFHVLLRNLPASFKLEAVEEDFALQQDLSDALQISWDDLQRLRAVWGTDFIPYLEEMAARPRQIRLKLLSGSLSEYRRATNSWWDNIESACPALRTRPVYFISSNPHSLANVLTGFALRQQDGMRKFLAEKENGRLLKEWNDIEERAVPSSRENFLYYILKKYQSSRTGAASLAQQQQDEQTIGLVRVASEHSFDVEAQVVELAKLKTEWLDPRLDDIDSDLLRQSDALIVNIDYPLGLAAYNILAKVGESVGRVLGVYVMGKAATLNAVVGDVMIPNVVHDEQSQNTYLFANCFTASHVSPYLIYGTVLDNQKAVTVQGTFLQNEHYMDIFYREGYTDIEMEAGPYLSAVYEMYRPRRHPANEIVNFYGLPFDLGIIHYASDIPLSKGKNLGAGSLSYYGMDSTYAVTLAILRRIMEVEDQRLASAKRHTQRA